MSKYDDYEIIEGEIVEEIPASSAKSEVLEGEIIINRGQSKSADDEMLDYAMRKGWWLLLVRGMVLTAMGLIALFVPDAALNLLVLLLGAYIVFDGLIHFINGLRRRSPTVVRGLLGIGIGTVIAAYSSQLASVTSSAIVYVIGGFLLLAGVISLLGALRAGRVRWVGLIVGAVMLGIGALMFVDPNFFSNTFVRIVGFFILLGGILVIVFAFKLRQVTRKMS